MSLSPKFAKSLNRVVAGADELHELLQKEKEQGVQPDSEHAVDAYLKANVADTPEKVITEVRLCHTACKVICMQLMNCTHSQYLQ